MAQNGNSQERAAIGGTVERHVRPLAKIMLKALALPAAGVAAAGVLLLVGISLVLAALVLLAAVLAGAVAVPLAVLAGRRRRAVQPRTPFSGQVMDAEATVRVLDKSSGEEQDTPRTG